MVGWEGLGPRDSKNVSFVDVELVQTVLDLLKSWGWKKGVDKGLYMNFFPAFQKATFIGNIERVLKIVFGILGKYCQYI